MVHGAARASLSMPARLDVRRRDERTVVRDLVLVNYATAWACVLASCMHNGYRQWPRLNAGPVLTQGSPGSGTN